MSQKSEYKKSKRATLRVAEYLMKQFAAAEKAKDGESIIWYGRAIELLQFQVNYYA